MTRHRFTIHRLRTAVNDYQMHRTIPGFLYAFLRKFTDDAGSYQIASLTYYSFLSLFPLLIVLTSVADIIARHHTALRAHIISGFTTYFPIVGNQLQANVHNSPRTGLALVIGLVISLYGATGVAGVAQHSMNTVWHVPQTRRPAFPWSLFVSVILLIGGGIGLIGTTILSGVATLFGHSWVLAMLSVSVSTLTLFGTFSFIMTTAGSGVALRDVLLGAFLATIGIEIAETTGGYLITHELHHLQGAYGQFSLVLAILFWLYILAGIFFCAIEINVVHRRKLWPRSMF